MLPELSASNDRKQFCQSVTYFHRAPKSWKLTAPRFSRSNMPVMVRWKSVRNKYHCLIAMQTLYLSLGESFLGWKHSMCHLRVPVLIHRLKCIRCCLCQHWKYRSRDRRLNLYTITRYKKDIDRLKAIILIFHQNLLVNLKLKNSRIYHFDYDMNQTKHSFWQAFISFDS